MATYERGQFSKADALIAFMGPDIRVRDSGQFRGERKLTKKGDSEPRRLLFNTAMQGRRGGLWVPYHLTMRTPGMSTTLAFVALGRKLARVSFALLRNGTGVNPQMLSGHLPWNIESVSNHVNSRGYPCVTFVRWPYPTAC